jgi:hypothetical protein
LGNGCRVKLRLGDADIMSFESRSDWVNGSPCRVDIDPHAVRVWTR